MVSVEVVIPVLNEEPALTGSVDTLVRFFSEALAEYQWWITIADNGSTDGTLAVARRLAEEHRGRVGVLHLAQKGRGRALRKAWLGSQCDIVAYMDVDLSTGLEAFPLLVHAIADEGCHLAVGSRLLPGSETRRSFRREVISRIYNGVIRLSFQTRFSDAQCGFKAMSRASAEALVPVIENNHWFFDTELLIIAEKRGFRVKDVPVRWNEDPDSRVKIVGTALEDLRGLVRLRFRGLPDVQPPPG